MKASGAGVHGGEAHVEVGLTERYKSSFEQSNPRSPSTSVKDTAEMVDDTSDAVMLVPVTKRKVS